jgi:DNA-binding response OmpR family regulator
MKSKILIVEDEPAMVAGLRDNFEYEGYEVISAEDGVSGLERALSDNPDLVVLDVMMPRMSGLDVCKQLKAKRPSVPIIMLTARGQEIDKVVGLELGADDYVTKPFSVRELMARVKAVLRRASAPAPAPETTNSATSKSTFAATKCDAMETSSISPRKSLRCSLTSSLIRLKH